MKYFLFTTHLVFASLFFAAPVWSADPDAEVIAFNTPDQPSTGANGETVPTHVEVVTGDVGTPREAAAVQAFLQQDLEQQLAANPQMQVNVVQLLGGETPRGIVSGDLHPEQVAPKGPQIVQKELPKGFFKRLKERVVNWKNNLEPYRVKFSLARFVAAEQTVFWTLILTKDAPVGAAIAMSLLPATVNAGFMLLNEEWQGLVLHPSIIREMLGISSDTTVGKAMNATATVFKWLGTETFFATLSKSLLWALALSSIHSNWDFIANVGSTVFITTVGEFPWGLSIALLTKYFKNLAATEPDKRRVQFKSDVTILGLSLVGVGCSIAQLAKVPHAFGVMGAVAVSGWALLGGTGIYLWKNKRPQPPDDCPAALVSNSK